MLGVRGVQRARGRRSSCILVPVPCICLLWCPLSGVVTVTICVSLKTKTRRIRCTIPSTSTFTQRAVWGGAFALNLKKAIFIWGHRTPQRNIYRPFRGTAGRAITRNQTINQPWNGTIGDGYRWLVMGVEDGHGIGAIVMPPFLLKKIITRVETSKNVRTLCLELESSRERSSQRVGLRDTEGRTQGGAIEKR